MKEHRCYGVERKLWIFAFIDFFSKLWAVSTFKYPVCVSPFLSFHVVYNRGISWSMFSSAHPYIFFIISVVAGSFLFFFSWYTFKRRAQGHCTYAETLVIVGGTANFIDRLYHKAVVDFIQLSWGCWSFPIFNVADICIVVGVGLMLWQTYFASKQKS